MYDSARFAASGALRITVALDGCNSAICAIAGPHPVVTDLQESLFELRGSFGPWNA
jgi:hypothetical protein